MKQVLDSVRATLGGPAQRRRRRAASVKMGLRRLFGTGLALFLFLELTSLDALAARILLADFGESEAESILPHGDWNRMIRHPDFTRFVRPDDDPRHDGIAEGEGAAEQGGAFAGVQGSTPIEFRRGQRIVASFYNNSDEYAFLVARLSFVDLDAPNGSDSANPWYTMSHPFFKAEGEWMPPRTVIELEYYLADENMRSAPNGFPSAGPHRLININQPLNDPRFILTKIELADDADLLPPSIPEEVVAEVILWSNRGGPAVRVSWRSSIDFPENQAAVSRYLIYRDGELLDMVPAREELNENSRVQYIDLNVAPGTTYSYHVSALDGAPFGMYPTTSRPHSRAGNESARAGPAVVAVPEWDSPSVINPWRELVYLGAFRLPYSEDEPWAYASIGLAYFPKGNPARNPGAELPGSLYALTQGGQAIAELSIPIPVVSSDPGQLGRARYLQVPVDLWPRIYQGSAVPQGGADWRAAGLTYHAGLGETTEGLYYGICNGYATDPSAPSHGWFSLDLTRAVGAWYIGAPPPDNFYPGLTARILFAAPQSWADTFAGGRSLIVGSTFLSGGLDNRTGPTLLAVAPWNDGNLLAPEEPATAVPLLLHGSITSQENRSLNWNIDEFGEGGAWLSARGKSAVAISCRRSVGDVWYGDSLGSRDAFYDIPEPEFGEKGGAATRWKTGLMLYDPEDLAEVALGITNSWVPQPYAVFDLDSFSIRSGGGDGTAGAIAFSPEHGWLFFIEHNGDPGYENGYGLIHAWRLAVPARPELSARIIGGSCVVSWLTENDGRRHLLQYSAALGSEARWISVSEELVADGSAKTVSHSAPSGIAAFYRLLIEP